MKDFDKTLIEKYFNGQCTKREVELVLEWFDTAEGKKYLEENLDKDVEQALEGADDTLMSSGAEPDSEKILSGIFSKMEQTERKDSPRVRYKHTFGKKKDYSSAIIKIAASILILFGASLFYFMGYEGSADEPAHAGSSHFATSGDQQKQVTLADGTEIQLNSNSEIWIPDAEAGTDMEVELSGEAYFDVAHDPEREFTVQANETVIEVLGTSFNINSRSPRGDVQVAVVDGSVSFYSDPADNNGQSVILEKGQYAYLDIATRQISVEDFGVQNYLSWMSGRLVFDDLKLDKVCLQLNRIYQVECGFEKEDLKDLRLTADFSNESLDKTLSVIALSLDLDYRSDNHRVIWAADSAL